MCWNFGDNKVTLISISSNKFRLWNCSTYSLLPNKSPLNLNTFQNRSKRVPVSKFEGKREVKATGSRVPSRPSSYQTHDAFKELKVISSVIKNAKLSNRKWMQTYEMCGIASSSRNFQGSEANWPTGNYNVTTWYLSNGEKFPMKRPPYSNIYSWKFRVLL